MYFCTGGSVRSGCSAFTVRSFKRIETYVWDEFNRQTHMMNIQPFQFCLSMTIKRWRLWRAMRSECGSSGQWNGFFFQIHKISAGAYSRESRFSGSHQMEPRHRPRRRTWGSFKRSPAVVKEKAESEWPDLLMTPPLSHQDQKTGAEQREHMRSVRVCDSWYRKHVNVWSRVESLDSSEISVSNREILWKFLKSWLCFNF